MDTFRMAWRNVWRNRRRSLITIAAIALALFSMAVYSGLVAGYLIQLEKSALDYETADIQIAAKGYRDKPSIYTGIDKADELVASLDKAGFPASARFLAGGLAAAGDTSAGVSIRGIEVASDARVSLVGKQVASGSWIDPAHPSEIVIGRRLARTLAVNTGSELVILTQGADGSMANKLYKVRGVLKGIAESTDRSGVFMTVEAFRELMVYEGGPHQILVRRPQAMKVEAATTAVRALAPNQDVENWRQILPTLASLLDATVGVMYFMFFIVYIAIAVVILNAMLMAVFERIREFGVLKAIGMGPGRVMSLILIESAVQTWIAVFIGLALSVPAVWYLEKVGIDRGRLGGAAVAGIATDPIWRASFTTSVFVGPVVTLIILVTLAVLYPGIKAARLAPIEAMRHQ